MFKQNIDNIVFRRYNTAVVVAFIVIVFIALAAATLRYYGELSEHKQRGLNQLNAQANQLNSMLVQSERAVSGIQELAEYIMKYPSELYAKSLPLRQEDTLFFIDKPNITSLDKDKRISGNITGFGNINTFSMLKKQEILMANALTPAFVSAQKVIEEANWFYYVSVDQFVNIYPWIGRDSWRFSDRMLTNPHAKKIKSQGYTNNKIIWSDPYIDAAGTGMNFSLGMGVYRNFDMLGAIVIDISLTRLQESLPELSSDKETLVLFNQSNDILIFKQNGKEPLSYRSSFESLLPEGLHHLKGGNLTSIPETIQIGDWLVEQQALPINGWILLKYQPYSNFISPLQNHFVFMFTILLVGLLAFLMLVNAMTKRSFIKPTHDFISHIEHCAKGDPGIVKANSDWVHWFNLVEDIFTQNRTLLLQLQEQNEVLDTRVLEKTKELQDTSIKHQRDYVLLRSVMNAIPELIIFNDPNGKLIGCNHSFEKLCNNVEDEMLGYKASTFMPKELAVRINKIDEDNDHTYPKQLLIHAGDNSYQGFFNQFTNDQNEPLGTITILQNVTEQQAIQSALEKAKNQAEYANKVKIQFLANMSHEIRTPINATQGMLDLLSRTQLDSRQEHYLYNAQTAAFTLLHLIDELLDLSKIEAGKMVIIEEVADLPLIIDTALKLNSSNAYAKKLNIQVVLSANVPRFLFSDKMRLIQVISNLLNNAIKFTDEGEVSLFVETIELNYTKALLRFKVIDTGIGISKDNQEHLFKAFSQADISMTRKYGGSGLGLSICQQIVKLLGGEITLESDLGLGCKFSFDLPFSLPAIETIGKYSNVNMPSNVHICSIHQKLSDSCVETIKTLSWEYHQFDNINALNDSYKNKKMLEIKLVLLIDEKTLAQQINDIDGFKTINLIGLCQPAMFEINSNTCHRLENYKLPYIILDTPLYRFALDQISNKLADISEENIKLKSIDQKTSNFKSSAKDLSNINVLLVEDNLVNQLVAKELLLSMNAEVTIADNGQKAIELISDHTFDVVLMDIQMPIMDGLMATKELRKIEKYQSLPIIAMTAHAREEDKLRSIEAGMNQHISKPVTSNLLLDSILKVLDQH